MEDRAITPRVLRQPMAPCAAITRDPFQDLSSRHIALTPVRCMTVCQAPASFHPHFILATGDSEGGQLHGTVARSTIA